MSMPRISRGTLIPACVFIAVAILIAFVPDLISAYHVDTGTRVGIYFIAILSLNLVLGFAGQISLGQGALMLVGAFTTGILNHRYNWPILETLPVAFLISFAIGACLGLPALRLEGIYLALVTFAFAFALPELPNKYTHFFGGSSGFQFGPHSDLWAYHTTWIMAGILFLGVWLLLRGRTGRAFRSIRDAEIAATSSGVSLPIYKVLAFALSGGIAGVAGSMLAVVNNSFVSAGEFSVLLSLTILIGGAVGGLGSLWGMLIGALFIGVLPDLSSSVPIIGSDHGRDVVYALIVILVMFAMPDGFAGLLRQLVLRATRSQRQAATLPPSPAPPSATGPTAPPEPA
jgi:branched-chain amino acid transport system permease protein